MHSDELLWRVHFFQLFSSARRSVMLGNAGDKRDDDIRNLTEVAARLKPDLVVIYELEGYQRRRSVGEIPSLISSVMTRLGLTKDQIVVTPNPVLDAEHFLVWAREGDVLLLQTLSDRDEVLKIFEFQTESKCKLHFLVATVLVWFEAISLFADRLIL